MALAEYETKCQVKCSKETCMKAAMNAVEKLSGFNIERIDRILGVIYLKGKMSLFSWGEIVEIRMMGISDELVEISVISTPKVGMSANAPGLYGDMGKNKKNVISIMSAISDELRKYIS